jgi:hypothetical protein
MPDGFADCPWCGAVRGSAATVAASAFDAVSSSRSALQNALVWIGISLCSASILILNHFAVLGEYGPRGYSSAYVIGRVIGSYVIPAICVFLYYKISGKKAVSSVKFLVISCVTVLWLFLLLAAARPRSPYQQAFRGSAEADQQAEAEAARTVPPTKWDPAIRSFFDDVRSFHMRYVSAVSETETSAVPLCSPESFRDAASIEQAMSQLRRRLAVAKEFSSPETLLSKMPQYVEAIDATGLERKNFLEGFNDSARKDLGARKNVSDNEVSWAQSCIAVYHFALAHQNDYSLQNGQVVFTSKNEGSEFDRKQEIAKLSHLEFLHAYGRFMTAQNASFTQLGLPPLDFGGRPSTASSVTDFLSHSSQGADPKSAH